MSTRAGKREVRAEDIQWSLDTGPIPVTVASISAAGSNDGTQEEPAGHVPDASTVLIPPTVRDYRRRRLQSAAERFIVSIALAFWALAHVGAAPIVHMPFASPVFGVYLAALLLCSVALLLASWMDPGILEPSAANLAICAPNSSSECEVNGLHYRFCVTCQLWRPPMCHHCSDCGFCVLERDHHCSVIGNCVGRRNHRFFLLMIGSAGLAALLLFGVTVQRLMALHDDGNMWRNWNWYLSLAIAIYAGYAGIMGTIAATTSFLMVAGAGRRWRHLNAFCHRAQQFCCSPLGPGVKRAGRPETQGLGYFAWQ